MNHNISVQSTFRLGHYQKLPVKMDADGGTLGRFFFVGHFISNN